MGLNTPCTQTSRLSKADQAEFALPALAALQRLPQVALWSSSPNFE